MSFICPREIVENKESNIEIKNKKKREKNKKLMIQERILFYVYVFIYNIYNICLNRVLRERSTCQYGRDRIVDMLFMTNSIIII